MIIVIYIVLLLLILIAVYNFIIIIRQYNVATKIKQKIVLKNAIYEQRKLQKKIINEAKVIDKLYLLLIKTGIVENKFLWWVTPSVIIFFCSVIFIVSIIIFLPVLKLEILTVIFCIPIATIPILILIFLSDIYEQRMEKNLINYIIQLKNQAKINNDIIVCFRNTKKYCQKPLSTHIQMFLFEIQQGINISTAFNNLKTRVDFNRFKQLINHLENSYFNGGNLYNLLDKTQKIFLKLQNERNKRNEETVSARIVLIVLIVISLFIYFRFINFNQENFNIMINSFWGQIILIINFLSIWGMLLLILYVKKFDN